MNQILRKFEQKVWKLILVTRAKHTVFIIAQAWDDWFESEPTQDFSDNRGMQYQKPRENLD